MPPTTSPSARKLVLFNHKGGVGKTTLTVNLAYALAEQGKRVLLVDTDPQCSMSSFFLEEKYLDGLLDQSESPAGNTLWSALKPVSEGSGPYRLIKPVQLSSDRLHIAVGDIRLAEFENSLSECWNLAIGRNRRGYLCSTALSSLVDELAVTVKADFVFYDAGPNIGPLNRVIVLDCSHFIVPAACDLFSTRALKTLGYALNEWIATWQTVVERAPDGTQLLKGRPKLAGFVPQGFRIYGGRMASSPLAELGTFESKLIDFVWRPMQKAFGLTGKEPVPKLKLGEIRDFGSLVTDSQSEGTAIWNVSGGNADNKADARRAFTALAKNVITATA